MIPAKKFFYSMIAGVCVLAVISGCKKKADAPATVTQPTAPAQTVVPSAPAQLQLQTSKPIAKDVDALPRIANPVTDGQKKVNATLDQLDKGARSTMRQSQDYERSVTVTMAGPKYLSLAMGESWDGGAYPASMSSAIVFDLSTGQAVDWTKLVTGKGVKSYSDSGADGKLGKPLALIYPALMAMYMEDPDNGGECKDAYEDPQSFMIYPDAKTGTLIVSAFDLPHVVQACMNDMTLTLDQAKKLGFNQGFLDAVAAAHAQPGSDKLGTQ